MSLKKVGLSTAKQTLLRCECSFCSNMAFMRNIIHHHTTGPPFNILASKSELNSSLTHPCKSAVVIKLRMIAVSNPCP